MSLKVPKFFGDLSESELQRIENEYKQMETSIYTFQHRRKNDYNARKRSPIIKASKYTIRL